MKSVASKNPGLARRLTPIGAAVAGLLYGAAYAPVLQAQAATAEQATDTTLEEIVVTASRRATSVKDIPFNISAVSGEQIEAQNLLNPVDLLRTVPGVSVVDRGVRNAGTMNNVRIRGVNSDAATLGDYVPAGATAVSSYVNDTPIFANFLLNDIDRVEVLRGPQGTLYGRGSMGGTVRYILRDPVIGQTSGNVDAGVSFTDSSGGTNWNFNGTVNFPLADNLALRANYSHVDNAGVVDYPNLYKLDANGIPVAPKGLLDQTTQYTSKKDADWSKIDYGRVALNWKPNSSTDWVLDLVGQKDSTGGRSQITPPGTPNYAVGGVYGKYEQGAVMLEPSDRKVWLSSLEGTFDLGFASLTSSTSYTDHTGTSTNDNSGLYAKAFPFLYNFYPRLMAQKYRDYSDKSFAQEFRLVSNTQGPLDYIAGLFYENEKMHSGETDWVRGYSQWYAAQNAVTPGFSYYDPVAPTSDRDYLYSRDEQYQEIALFGELTYHVTPNAQVTGGARVFRYKDSNQLSVMPDLPTRQPLVSPVTPDVTKNESIFKLNGLYRLSAQDNLYATFSQGYRRGGVNDIPIKPPSNVGENAGWMNFGPDTLDNYELGVKGAHGTISYNLSVFDIEWKDIQLNTATPVWGYYVTINAGKARSKGFELELHGKLGESLTYGLGYTYADAKLTSDATQPFAVAPNPPVVIAPSGTRLPAAPENVLNASLDYTVHLASGLTLVPHVDAYYQSSTLSHLDVTEAASDPLSGYSIWNAQLALNGKQWTVALTVRNLTNAYAVSGIYPESRFGSAPLYPSYFDFFFNTSGYGFFGDTTRELIARPRTIGLIAKYSF
jgi:outer membrane receptor protein involved in Fe transport